MRLPSILIFAALACLTARAQSPATQPEPRVMSNLIYHNQLKRILLLDGLMKEPIKGRTKIWSWDGNRWQLLSEDGPLARALGGVAYDSRRNKIVLYGGRSWPNDKMKIKSDTWEWDTQQWELVSDTSAGLNDLHHISMVYDENESMTLQVGGVEYNEMTDKYEWPSNTWGWSGNEWNMVASSGPSGRITTMTYDSKNHQIILFGGSTPEGSAEPLNNDTWIWDGKSWKKYNGISPSARNGHAMTYDSNSGLILMYGGWTRQGERKLGDMWQWDGQQWKEIILSGSTPGKRGGHGLAYDPIRKRTVLFGGDGLSGTLNDTWEWDGEKWMIMNSKSQ